MDTITQGQGTILKFSQETYREVHLLGRRILERCVLVLPSQKPSYAT